MNNNFYPIVFIPGIMATSLEDHYSMNNEEVYNVLTEDFKSDLFSIEMDENGKFDKSLYNMIKAGKALKLIYSQLIQELRESLKIDDSNYVPVYIFTYDWRRSIKDNSIALKKYIEEILKKISKNSVYREVFGSKDELKVNIVAHSMGCLVGSKYLKENKKFVYKSIFVAPPFRGAVNSIKTLVMGDSDFFGILSRKGKRKVIRTFPSVYNLILQNGNDENIPQKWKISPILDKNKEELDIYKISSWQENFIKKIGENKFKNYLKQLKSEYSDLYIFDDDIKKNILVIYGNGEKTPSSVILDNDHYFDFNEKYSFCKDGDGTVLVNSCYSPGVFCFPVYKKDSNFIDYLSSTIAGFHSYLSQIDLVQDAAISFLRGKINKNIQRKQNRIENNWFKKFF